MGAVLALLHHAPVGGSSEELSRQDEHGRTLLHYACALQNAPALRLLLAAHVDPRVADAGGATAVDWARQHGFHEGEALIAHALGGQPLDAHDGTIHDGVAHDGVVHDGTHDGLAVDPLETQGLPPVHM